MFGTKVLLFTALGLGGALLLLGGEAKASPKTEPTPPPAPKPSGSTESAAQRGGEQCRQAFQRWRGLADGAATLCAKAEALAEEWWTWEDYRLAGEFSYDPAYHEQVRRDWETAQDACNNQNAASLGAMAEYEECMLDLGLNPALPSGATV